jgi:hypothetical protein
VPEKYHIKTCTVPPRLTRIGKCGVVDWREDCARCHNCVKKACVFDRYNQETQYIRGLTEVDAFFNECMGCFLLRAEMHQGAAGGVWKAFCKLSPIGKQQVNG